MVRLVLKCAVWRCIEKEWESSRGARESREEAVSIQARAGSDLGLPKGSREERWDVGWMCEWLERRKD